MHLIRMYDMKYKEKVTYRATASGGQEIITEQVPVYNKFEQFAKKQHDKRVNKLSGKDKPIKIPFIFRHPGVCAFILGVFIILVVYLISSANSYMDELIKQYTTLTAKTNDSKYSFDKKLFYVTVEADGTKKITFGYKSEQQQEQAEQAVEEATGGEDTAPSVEITPASGDAVINKWLLLNKDPSGTGDIKSVPSNITLYNPSKWSMGEGSTLKKWNKWMMGLYSDTSYSRPTIDGKTVDIGQVNSDGRYWVAIGPSWFNPGLIGSNGYTKSQPGAGSWFADGKGHNFDIVVEYQSSTYYIYCVMGDSKAHTFGDGMGYCQSGINWNGGEKLASHRDFSVVEWCGASGNDGASLNTQLTFKGIICY